MENNVNLNLIRTLILLKKHKNMRTVAKILDKSESAISKDISKLNKEFAKELFIRTRNGFEASYYLEQIFQELEFTYN
ncbi:LysR family transcriptional regulator, partial [Vibrio parahaemolyticus]|nr:LysR family transcriptional regulator [Vibrio parahaemolyticus]